MRDRLAQAQRAGAEFFQKVLKAGDQAFILGFDRQAQMLRPWSREPAELITALSSIRAEEMTALYDAIISALYQFQGVRGQRALVLISDGRDTASRFSWDQALEYSKRAGVPLYVIGLGISGISIDVRPRLAQLAAETGGTAFFINDPTELGSIYQQIETELRSQYLLAFYPAADAKPGGEWRPIRVQVQGANAKTTRGYYP
jgi:VWFA-related protein